MWQGCYDEGWKGEIVPESFAHPAKFARSLICRIYAHAFAEGWLSPGMTVVDPFGGVALGALDAMWNGLSWVGVELEPKFCALAEKNIELWQRKYGSKDGFGSALIFQGDSRKLSEVIAGADLVCSSPPYSECVPNRDRRGEAWFEAEHRKKFRTVGRDSMNFGYGSSPSQLGVMKEGDFDCVVSSPPYADNVNAKSHGIDWTKVGPSTGNRKRGEGTQHEVTLRAQLSYGSTNGQLGSLPEGRFEAVISSPPWEETDAINNTFAGRLEGKGRWAGGNDSAERLKGDYAKMGSMGNSNTFWSAAREILIQCHTILKPGGHAIWVTKDFIRKGQRVPFFDQWQALCESVGFRLVCQHRAMLVKNHGEQGTIFGGTEQLTTKRKSFFRHLAEKKGSPAIDWEEVLCFSRKPENW